MVAATRSATVHHDSLYTASVTTDGAAELYMTTPKLDGLHMPAEWDAHSKCWMAWPSNRAVWGETLVAAQAAYINVAQAIADFEPVTIVADPASAADVSLRGGRGISVFACPHDDAWIRDNGPTFVTDGAGGLAGVDWQWNAWGEIYPDYENDAAVAREILSNLRMRRYEAPLVLEGGSIHVDGEGTALTTEECLLNPNRNAKLDRHAIEDLLRAYLGVEAIIWLAGGLQDDETDGHVDNIACFARPGVVIVQSEADPNDGNYTVLQENLARLRAATDARGRQIDIIELPQPRRVDHGEARLALSYVNFYLANGAVIAPQFDDAEDSRALNLLKDTFQDRSIVPVDVLDIVKGGGGIHCITQQQPAGEALPPQ